MSKNTAAKQFTQRLEQRIASEFALAHKPGIRVTAKDAALRRHAEFSADLSYIRAFYCNETVMVGEGDAQ